MRLTFAGIGTAVAAATLLAMGARFNYAELTQIGVAGLTGVAMSAALAARRPRFAVWVRQANQPVVEGEPAEISIVTENRGRRRHPATVLRFELDDRPVAIRLHRLRAGTRAEVRTALAPLRRGVYHISAARLSYHDPFDFARAETTVGAPATLHVYPRTELVAPMPDGGPEDLDGHPVPRLTIGGEVFYSLREYLPGDSWRRIHWPSTAHQAILTVRHTTAPQETVHVVLLDTERQAYQDESYFEQAVRIAASICRASVRHGHALSLVAGAGSAARPAVDQPPDAEEYGPEMDLLAQVRLTDVSVDLRPLTAMPADACLVAVTGQPTPVLVGWLVEVGRHLAAGYLVQVLDSAQRPADPPPPIRSLPVGGLDAFRTAWRRMDRS